MKVTELIVDAYGCQGELLNAKVLEQGARKAIGSVGATIVGEAHHQFQPHGLTLCFILKESHFVLSTWPEYKMAVMNIFLCSPNMDAQVCWKEMESVLLPKRVVTHHVPHRIESDQVAA